MTCILFSIPGDGKQYTRHTRIPWAAAFQAAPLLMAVLERLETTLRRHGNARHCFVKLNLSHWGPAQKPRPTKCDCRGQDFLEDTDPDPFSASRLRSPTEPG